MEPAVSSPAIHPGHALLRALVPSTDVRRAFVRDACAADVWNPAALIRAVAEANGRTPVNVTPEQARLVRAFIEAI